MKKLLTLFILACPTLLFSQSWSQVVDFAGSARDDAASFSIGDFGYVLTGMDAGFNTTNNGFKYHAYTYVWYPIDSLPAEKRQYSCGFAINGKGYIVGGKGADYYNDCWQYDPTIDSWTEMDSIPSLGRASCTCFVINGKAYIGTGATTGNILTNEWWEFSPDSANQWTQKNNFPGIARKGATGFEINGKGYLMTGIDSNSTMHNDVWEYDASLDSWIPKNNFNGTSRFLAKAISVNNIGYIMTGWDNTGNFTNDLWQYNDLSDSWTSLDTIPAYTRKGGCTFTVNGNLFYTTGILGDNYRTTETWAYGNSIGIESNQTVDFKIYPNPSHLGCIINCDINNVKLLEVISITGRKVYSSSFPHFPFYLNNMEPGIYFAVLHKDGNSHSIKLIFY